MDTLYERRWRAAFTATRGLILAFVPTLLERCKRDRLEGL